MSRFERGVLNETRPVNLKKGNMVRPLEPVMRSKARALASVPVNKDCSADTSATTKLGVKPTGERLVKQKANATRLASGLSVSVFKKPEAIQDKENCATRKKAVAIIKPIPAANPVRPKKQPVAPTSRNVPLVKSESLVSLFLPEEKAQNKKPIEQKPLTEAAPLAGVEDPDADYLKHEFILGEYAKDIYQHLSNLERTQAVRKNYLTKGHIMTGNMRALLVDWMYEVKQALKLLGETIQLAVGMLDRYMQDHPSVGKSELQLVGITCIFLAAKYEEIFPPDVEDLIDISARTYTKAQILRMEISIFSALKFQIGRPSPLHFLRRYGRISKVDMTTYCFAKYFVDLAMVQYSKCHLMPSLLAAGAIYLASYLTQEVTDTPDSSLWTPTLQFFSNYEWDAVRPVVNHLAAVVWDASTIRYQAVQKNYMDPKTMSVSERAELKSDKLRELAQQRAS